MAQPLVPSGRLAEQMLALRKFEYFGRYRDYWARPCRSLQDQAWEDGADGQEAFNLFWTDVRERLKSEQKASRRILKDTPTLLLVYQTCASLKLSPEHMLWAIERYGEGNQVMYNSVTELIHRGDWTEFATLLHNDARDVEKVIPDDMQDDLRRMWIIIDEIRDAYFEVDSGDEDDPRTWIPTRRARELKTQFRKEGAEKLAAKEAKIARMKDSIARREAEEVMEDALLLRALRGVRRQPGPELPDWAKQLLVREKQKEKLLRLQTEIEKLEVELDVKYQEREELVKEMKEFPPFDRGPWIRR